MGLRERILECDDLPRVAVEVPEWGVTLYVRALTAAERVDLGERVAGDGALFMAHVVCACTVDEDGEQVFNQDDAAILARKNGQALKRLFDAADHLNAFTERAVEELEKN